MKKISHGYKNLSAGMNAKITSGIFITVLIFILIATTSLVAAGDNLKGDTFLYPGGFPFGVRIDTEGLIIEETVLVDSPSGGKSPCADAGIKPGDIILRVNGKVPSCTRDFANTIEESGGRDIILELSRGEKNFGICVNGEKSLSDGKYHLGLIVRDQAAGIGTVTFIMPDKTHFAGLGHGIYDSTGKNIIKARSGGIYDVIITAVIKGRQGKPGELHGRLSALECGSFAKNSPCGIYGSFNEPLSFDASNALPAAENSELHEGDAYILSTLDGNRREKYGVRISRLDFSSENGKNFVIEITDKELIERSGGIIQGMSGSPVIQDGKLIGAITHVLVDNPKCGYGISVQNMLKTMPNE